MLVCLKSTVEILVIPELLAAFMIEASTPKTSTCRKPVPFAVPTLLPTGLLEMATGRVIEQEDMKQATAQAEVSRKDFLNISIIILKDCLLIWLFGKGPAGVLVIDVRTSSRKCKQRVPLHEKSCYFIEIILLF
jgi:hypothetical protein